MDDLENLAKQLRAYMAQLRALSHAEEDPRATAELTKAEVLLAMVENEMAGRHAVSRRRDPPRSRPARERRPPPPWLKKALVVAAVVAIAAIATYTFWPRAAPPRFLKRQGQASFAELLQSPETFTYGSEISFWVFEDEDSAIDEVVCTGHADEATCRRVSSLLFNTYLEAADKDNDMVVAGMGWFSRRRDPERERALGETGAIQNYLAAERGLIEELFDSLAEGEGQGLETRLAALGTQIDSLKNDPDVAEYLNLSRNEASIQRLMFEAAALADSAGLIGIHYIPAGLRDSTRARVNAAVTAGTPSVVRFDDLTDSFGVAECAIAMPVLSITTGEPIELVLDDRRLTANDFDEARLMHRSDVERSMVGDATRRKEFFLAQRDDLNRQASYYANLSEARLDQEIILNTQIDSQGNLINLPPEEWIPMTARHYRDNRLPDIIKSVNEWLESVEGLLEKIEGDRELGNSGRIAKLTHAILLDSMLRDWRLPVARDQAAFDRWRANRRALAWKVMRREAGRVGVDWRALSGEQLVFRVTTEGHTLRVAPIHIVDPGNTLVIVDPEAGCTRAVSTWEARKEVPSTGPADSTLAVFEKALTGAGAIGEEELARIFDSALCRDPAATARLLETTWALHFGKNAHVQENFRAKLTPVVEARGFRRGYERLQTELSLLQEDPEAMVSAFRSYLDDNPDAPTELFLEFAVVVAELCSGFLNVASEEYEEIEALGTWDFIELARRKDVQRSRPSALSGWSSEDLDALIGSGVVDPEDIRRRIAALTQGRDVVSDPTMRAVSLISSILGANPLRLIRDATTHAEQSDPEYFEKFWEERGLPAGESSTRWMQYEEASIRSYTPLERSFVLTEELREYVESCELVNSAADEIVDADYARLDGLAARLALAEEKAPIGGETLRRIRQQLEKDRLRLDTLTRIELSWSLATLAERLKDRALGIADEDPEDRRGIMHPRVLDARVWFDGGYYARAFDIMYEPRVALGLYHPDLRWSALAEGWLDDAWSLHIRAAEDTLLISGARAPRSVREPILAISGLPLEDSDDLKASLEVHFREQGNELHGYGAVSDLLLMGEVPLSPDVRRLRTLVQDNRRRLALIKAMVYGRTPPGGKFTEEPESSNQWVREAASVASFDIPTLDVVEESERTRISK